MILRPDQQLFDNCRQLLGLPQVNLAGLAGPQLTAVYQTTRAAAYVYINANGGMMPTVPFPEEHPYPPLYPVNPEWNTYIIGTFPPVNYLRDVPVLNQPVLLPTGEPLVPPAVPFYHGNVNALWRCLNPALFNLPLPDRLVLRQRIIDWLLASEINYIDMIQECQRRPMLKKGTAVHYPSEDVCYRNIIPNTGGIHQILDTKLSDPLIIANTSSTFNQGPVFSPNGMIINNNNRAFDMLIQVAQTLNYPIEFALDNMVWIPVVPANSALITATFQHKVIFYIKVNGKKFTVITGPSPGRQAAMRLANHHCFLNYLANPHVGYPATVGGFRFFVCQNSINRNFAPLWLLN